jgi:hypothetical protein
MIASLSDLAGPDLIVLAMIFLVLVGIPALIAIPIIFIVKRRSKKPPPLPKSAEPSRK